MLHLGIGGGWVVSQVYIPASALRSCTDSIPMLLLQAYNALVLATLVGTATATWQPYNDAIRPDIDDKIGYMSE